MLCMHFIKTVLCLDLEWCECVGRCLIQSPSAKRSKDLCRPWQKMVCFLVIVIILYSFTSIPDPKQLRTGLGRADHWRAWVCVSEAVLHCFSQTSLTKWGFGVMLWPRLFWILCRDIYFLCVQVTKVSNKSTCHYKFKHARTRQLLDACMVSGRHYDVTLTDNMHEAVEPVIITRENESWGIAYPAFWVLCVRTCSTPVRFPFFFFNGTRLEMTLCFRDQSIKVVGIITYII